MPLSGQDDLGDAEIGLRLRGGAGPLSAVGPEDVGSKEAKKKEACGVTDDVKVGEGTEESDSTEGNGAFASRGPSARQRRGRRGLAMLEPTTSPIAMPGVSERAASMRVVSSGVGRRNQR